MQKEPWEHEGGWAQGSTLSWVLKEYKSTGNPEAKQGLTLQGDPASFLRLDLLNHG